MVLEPTEDTLADHPRVGNRLELEAMLEALNTVCAARRTDCDDQFVVARQTLNRGAYDEVDTHGTYMRCG